MPLEILLAMVVGGIGFIAVALHGLGLSRAAELTADSARAAWLREFPDSVPTRLLLCQNRRAALVQTAAGPGLVWAIGADTTARFLTGARVARTARGLTVRLPDFTAPRIRLRLDPDEAARWPALMEAHP